MEMDFNRLAVKRRTHFSVNRLGTAPQTQEERLARAKAAIEKSVPDFETALVLYDKIDDFDQPEFQELMGDIFNSPHSPVYNIKEAEQFYKKSYAYYPDEKDQKRAARKLVNTYKKLNVASVNDLYSLHNDQIVFDCIMFLSAHGEEIELFRVDDNTYTTPYIIATYAGAGKGMPHDHEAAVQMYEAYLNSNERGHLAEAYQNLAIRYAFGLGISADIHKAASIARTGSFMLQVGSKAPLNHYADLLKDLSDTANRKDFLAPYAARTANGAWAFFDLINRSRMPTAVVELLSALAHQEDWEDKENWRSVHRKAAYTFASNMQPALYTGLSPSLTTFNPEMLAREPNRLSISPFRLNLYQYFEDKGWGLPPVEQEARRQFSLSLTNHVPPDYESALMLFDPDEDRSHSDWLLLVGWIHDQHLNNPFFDSDKAITFYKKSSDLGNSGASENLGIKYEGGNETKVDLDEALKWYEIARQQGSLRAFGFIADIKLRQRSLDNPTSDVVPDQEIAQLYLEGAQKGDFGCWKKYAQCQFNGTGIERSEQNAISNWVHALKKAPKSHEESIHASLAYQMAVRSFLGLGVDRNFDKSREYLNLIPDTSNHSYVRYTLKEFKELLLGYITNERSGHNEDLELIRHLYANPQNIQNTIRRLDQGGIRANNRLVNYVTCAKTLANWEEWPSRYDWHDLQQATQAHQLGFTFNQAVQSTRDSGPRYNALDSRGLPILGALMKPSLNENDERVQRAETGSYVPQPGMFSLKRIKANADGFKYGGEYSEDIPAMLTTEDTDISEILVFGDPQNGPSFPSLSLETANNDEYGKGETGNGYDKAFTYKIFSPQWLAYTDFGRTLWITDYLIGQWCWHPEKFKIGLLEEGSSYEQIYMADSLIRDLRLTGGRDGGASAARVMIQPKSNYIIPEPPNTVYKQAEAEVEIKQMTMKVYGSYILNDGNTENRSLFEEDPNFAQGRTVKKLTDRYNEIMQLDPRFERAQQLMALFYGHLRLWEIGFRPSDDLQRELSAKRAAMESLGRQKDEKLLVRRAFGLRAP